VWGGPKNERRGSRNPNANKGPSKAKTQGKEKKTPTGQSSLGGRESTGGLIAEQRGEVPTGPATCTTTKEKNSPKRDAHLHVQAPPTQLGKKLSQSGTGSKKKKGDEKKTRHEWHATNSPIHDYEGGNAKKGVVEKG